MLVIVYAYGIWVFIAILAFFYGQEKPVKTLLTFPYGNGGHACWSIHKRSCFRVFVYGRWAILFCDVAIVFFRLV
jgi:hypothetical protein